MKKINIVMILILLMPLVITNFESVDAGYVPAQGNPQQTGELLPNPELIIEPEVEIGLSSPEFSYDYEVGLVDLIWTHTPGYDLSFSYNSFAPYEECDEFARIKQEFTWNRNQTPITLKISASVQISCTGEFVTNETANLMYSIDFWMEPFGLPVPYRLKTIGDLYDGQSYDIEFLVSNYEVEGLFLAAGVQNTYTMSVGPVTATVYDFSVNALLEVDDIVPEMITPVYNTTTLWNDTYQGLCLESIGQDSLVHLSQNYGIYPNYQLSLGRLTSDHRAIWNQTVISGGFLYSVSDMKVVGSEVYLLGANQTGFGTSIFLMKLDSQGQEIWRKSVSVYGNDYPLFFDVASTGRIYVFSLATSVVPVGPDPFEILYNLICFDSLGTKLWNETVLTQSYGEYILAVYNQGLPSGIGCHGGEVYIGLPGELVKCDSSGRELWRRSFDFFAFCGDPAGGFFTCSIARDDTFQLSKWAIGGSIAWSQSMSIDYGPAWRDYPTMQNMKVGSDGFLYIVLEYLHIDPVITIAKVSRTGQVRSQDTISLYLPEYQFNSRPYVCDLAVTTDGLVHLATSSYVSTPYTPYNPFFPYTADFLLSYRLSAPSTFTLSPESLVITGVATLIFGGIAWDHFIRGRTRPEEIITVQEKVDPWEVLMGETEDE
jgi:hypothetical protein